jgi:hypothetical protein
VTLVVQILATVVVLLVVADLAAELKQLVAVVATMVVLLVADLAAVLKQLVVATRVVLLVVDLAAELKQLVVATKVVLLVVDLAAELKQLVVATRVVLLVADQAAVLKWLLAIHVLLLAAIAVVARSAAAVFCRRFSVATRRAAVIRLPAMPVLLHATHAALLLLLQ